MKIKNQTVARGMKVRSRVKPGAFVWFSDR